MTRARSELELVCPLRFHITQQHRYGDAHVYGARSRFLTPRVLATLREIAAPVDTSADAQSVAICKHIDAGARLRELW
jgi:DNA helicase-2/ATP-dependent DNA helicase PcrA